MAYRTESVPFDLAAYLDGALRQLAGSLPCEASAVYLVEPARQVLVRAARWGEAALLPPEVGLGEGLLGRVVLTGEGGAAEGGNNLLAAPLRVGPTPLGALCVGRLAPYAPADAAALRAAAGELAPIIHLAREHALLTEREDAHRRAFDAIQRLAMITSAAADPESMLVDAVRVAAELLGCGGAQVLLPDPISYLLKAHKPSTFGSAADLPVSSWPLDGPGYLVEVYHTGQPFVSLNPRPEAGLDCHSLIACPLNTRNRTLGVLHLLNCGAGAFDETLFFTAQAVANQIAVSLGSARIFAAERRRTEMLTQINRISQDLYATLDPVSLLRKVAQRVYQTFGHEVVYVFMLSEDRAWLELHASATSKPQLDLPRGARYPVTEGIVGRAVRAGATQIVANLHADPDYMPRAPTRRLQSALIVPLRRGEEVIGAISILSAGPDAFSDLESDALETLATQVSIALENAHLYDQAQRRLLEQTIVHQIGQDLTAILDYHELSVAMVQHMNRALSTSGCLVGLYESEQAAVRVTAEYHAPGHHDAGDSPTVGAYLPLETYVAVAHAIATRQPVTVYRSQLDFLPEAQALLRQADSYSRLVVPMIVGERVLGVVDWTDDNPDRLFSPDDIQLARTLVAQATIAVENALLFQELETRAIELAEVHRLRSQFLATISHELRTPMNSIIGFSETLIEGLYGELTDSQASRLQRIQLNGYSLLTLIEDLLDLSKIDAGRMKLHVEAVNLADILAVALPSHEDAAADKGLALSCECPPDLPRVRADPDRVQQVINNLLSNAIKFTHQGSVSAVAHRVQRRGRPFVAISVTDTGIGIRASDQAYIFDEFRQVDGGSTRAYGGTGLGLAISRKLVEMMGGEIGVESEPGKGSTFIFVLPVAVDEPERGAVDSRLR